LGCRRGLEHHDLPALGLAEPVRKAVGDDSVAESALTEIGRSGAVERRLHRRRWNAVRLGHLRFERQHEGNRDRDRDEPVDDRPPRLRYPALCTIQNSHGYTGIVRTIAIGARRDDENANALHRSWVAAGSQRRLEIALLLGSSRLSNPTASMPGSAKVDLQQRGRPWVRGRLGRTP